MNNAAFQIHQQVFRNPVSKHRQFDPETGKHIPGRCCINHDSSLRKLMRAANRGAVPNERIAVIVHAQQSAAARPEAWLSGYQKSLRIAAEFFNPQPVNSPPIQPEPEPMPTTHFPDIATSTVSKLAEVDSAIPQQSKVYSVKSNAARAAAKYKLERSDLFEVAGGWAFNVPVSA